MLKYLKRLKNSTLIYFAIVMVIVFVAFSAWIFQYYIVTDGDWAYYTLNSLLSFRLEYFSLWLNDQDFGRTILDVGQAPTYVLYGLMGLLGVEFNLSERLVHFIPAVVLAPLSSYIFLSWLSRSKLAIGSGTVVYCCNTYFLQLLTGTLTIAVAYALAPLVLILFIKNYTKPSLKRSVIAALCAFIMICYEPRIFYVIAIACILYFLIYLYAVYKNDRQFIFKDFIKIFLPFILTIILSAFWLLGVYAIGGDESGGILARSLFGNEFYKLENALTLSQPFWTGSKPESFVYHSISWAQWIIPLAALFGLILNRRSVIALYLGIITCIGILLSKQVSPPFESFYPWVYDSVPGFSAFREASKFYLLTAIGYAGLTTMLFDRMSRFQIPRYVKMAVPILVIVCLSFNLKPFVTGEVETTVSERKVPNSYEKWNKFISQENEFSRVMWVPNVSRWADNTTYHPSVSAVSVTQKKWAEFNEQIIPASGVTNAPIQNQIMQTFQQDVSSRLLSDTSTKYVVIPIRDTENDDDFFKDYSNDREFYIKAVSKIPTLKELSGDFGDLRVFLNVNFKPYFSSSEAMLAVRSMKDMNKSNSFIREVVPGGLNSSFILQNENGRLPGSVSSLYQINNLSDVSNIKNASRSNLFYKSPNFSYSYFFQDEKLTLMRSVDKDEIFELDDDNTANEILQEIKTKKEKKYYLSYNNKLLKIDISRPTERELGRVDGEVDIVSVNKDENLIKNGSFEGTVWNKDVLNCNAYDDKGTVIQNVVAEEKIEGRYSIELGSRYHTACIESNSIRVEPNQTYRLSYNFKLKAGQRAGYELTFNNGDVKSLSSDQTKTTDGWTAVDIRFSTPNDATKMNLKLMGYPDDRNRYISQIYYDAVKIAKVDKEINFTSDTEDTFRVESLKKTSLSDLKKDSIGSGKNLIQNPSFETGLWKEEVGDCNAYDNNPMIGMDIDRNATDGKASLMLNATNHTACTGPDEISVKENETYEFRFDYQSPNSNQAGYYIGFNDALGSSVSEKIFTNSKEWKTYTKNIKVPLGANRLSVTVYGYANEYANSKMLNRYDNFSLAKTADFDNKYYVLRAAEKTLNEPAAIDFKIRSSTIKDVNVKGASSGFFLNMSESYSKGWKLSQKNLSYWFTSSAVDESDHYALNGFLNTWYVDPEKFCDSNPNSCSKNEDGSYDLQMTVMFAPMNYLYVGLSISVVALLSCVSYLVYIKFNRRLS